jgi:3D (Asp-Asp-Asp) domain-containing protein
VATNKDAVTGAARRQTWYSFALAHRGMIAVIALALTSASAILAKEATSGRVRVQPLAATERVALHGDGRAEVRGFAAAGAAAEPALLGAPEDLMLESVPAEEIAIELDAEWLGYATDPSIRWFNGRPVRPAHQYWMTVTGYSPDEASCAPFADGLTATLHSVTANAMKLVAADTSLLPFGSLVTIPGYDDERVVPVLDRGGAIKGYKLDLLFPTHEEARQWGRQRIRVTIWEYADGLPPDNPREFR